eukprot:Seg3167.3 transcript_id=Seg3167.3/GoldUCD/mRNA.D3Y31 product="hypothetical protein" pseudo=true protein_id=Seg3167.3/GoldUCD/D3Y31
MSERYKHLKKLMEQKRDVNRKNKEDAGNLKKPHQKCDELTVQHLSTNVAGKAQKYTRIGPREFVPYRKDDLTFAGIKDARSTLHQK